MTRPTAVVPDREHQRMKSLAADHYRNARRLAAHLVAAEEELRKMKKERQS